MVIEKAELRRMSQAERRELAAMLAELEASHPDQAQVGQYRADPYRIDPVLRRERRPALLAFLAFAGARRLLRATVAASILAGAHVGATAAGATAAGATAAGAFPAGEWGRSCAGQSLRRAPLAGLGLDEALPRRRGGQGRQAA